VVVVQVQLDPLEHKEIRAMQDLKVILDLLEHKEIRAI
jgi:hypothetical protein